MLSLVRELLVPLRGSFVSSLNLTVILSPSENPETTVPSSLAVSVVINGPCFVPKSENRGGEPKERETPQPTSDREIDDGRKRRSHHRDRIQQLHDAMTDVGIRECAGIATNRPTRTKRKPHAPHINRTEKQNAGRTTSCAPRDSRTATHHAGRAEETW